ncbi:MAG TPA: trehalase family glycosidase [Fimbriimonas sp.]
MDPYIELKENLLRGWNTWNTRSVLSHVLLPDGIAINLGLREYETGQNLREALIGRFGSHEEQIHPGPHAYDGSYTELNLKWRGIELMVQTATEGEEWVALVTPLHMQKKPAVVYAEIASLWNSGCGCSSGGEYLKWMCTPGRRLYATGTWATDEHIPASGPYLARFLDGPVAFSSTWKRSLEEVQELVSRKQGEHRDRAAAYGANAELYEAMQTCMAWDTIYDPWRKRAITPVSRLWNLNHGGWVLFCWDTFFGALMAGVDHKGLAYSNAIEMLRERTEDGFVPNYSYATGQTSRDRSQPPVGSMTVRELYRKYRDRWLLEETFDNLLAWNRWWAVNRQAAPGLLAWGSNPYEPTHGNVWETRGVNERFGAALESGLDNSPMYDDMPFDEQRHVSLLADAGLMGLYLMDCRCLAEIAEVLGREEQGELREREAVFTEGLERLWDESSGIYRNLDLTTGEFSAHLSPTNFYPLLSGAPSSERAARMIDGHLLNPKEFWGEYVLPSISRDDPAYADNFYWRGRVWAPMNFLVYLALRKYPEVETARRELVAKSSSLFLQEWRSEGHVHENYNAETGDGDDVASSDKFYHWGGLLALMALIEDGAVEGWEGQL